MHRLGTSFSAFVLVFTAALLTGCLPPSSAGALKIESASLKQEIAINANYQQVYSRTVSSLTSKSESVFRALEKNALSLFQALPASSPSDL